MRHDPGPCPICGAAHTACTTDTGPITVVQLPARDAPSARTSSGPPLGTAAAPAADAGAGDSAPSSTSFTTATYRGKKAKGK